MVMAEGTWSLGEAKVQGKPVVYKFTNDTPSPKTKALMPWLTIISWKYDGSSNNGMPPKNINKLMIKLEDGLESIKGRGSLYMDVSTETGNNLKEFVFYISDREKFIANLNAALKGHPAYPIEITFYEDKEWTELAKLQSDFSVKH